MSELKPFKKTTDKIEAMSVQEVFDTVAKHLLTQGRRCELSKRCLYHLVLPDGKTMQCAAGCLIDPDEYDSRIDGMAWEDLVTRGFVGMRHRSFIQRLQSLHDEVPPQAWRFSLYNIAVELGLNSEVVDHD